MGTMYGNRSKAMFISLNVPGTFGERCCILFLCLAPIGNHHHLGLMLVTKFCDYVALFPTCKVRVSRFYRSYFLHPPNRELRIAVGTAAPQLRTPDHTGHYRNRRLSLEHENRIVSQHKTWLKSEHENPIISEHTNKTPSEKHLDWHWREVRNEETHALHCEGKMPHRVSD